MTKELKLLMWGVAIIFMALAIFVLISAFLLPDMTMILVERMLLYV